MRTGGNDEDIWVMQKGGNEWVVNCKDLYVGVWTGKGHSGRGVIMCLNIMA